MKSFAKYVIITCITFGLGAAHSSCVAVTDTQSSPEQTSKGSAVRLGMHRIDNLHLIVLGNSRKLDGLY